MDQLRCKKCSVDYSKARPPRLLPMCGHSLCEECLKAMFISIQQGWQLVCPQDGACIQVKDKELSQFPINKGLLQLTKEKVHFSFEQSKILRNEIDDDSEQLFSTLQGFDKSKSIHKSDEELCPMHHEPVKNVCLEHHKKICSDCALFGQHKGHDVMKIKDVIHEISLKAEHALAVSNEISDCQSKKLGMKLLSQISRIFTARKDKIHNEIKQRFSKIVQQIKREEKKATEKVDIMLNLAEEMAKEKLKSTQQINEKGVRWKTRVHDIAQTVADTQQVEQLIKFILETRENDLLRQGAQIISEIEKCHEEITMAVEKDASEIVVDFKEDFDAKIAEFCLVHKNEPQKPVKRKFVKDCKLNVKENVWESNFIPDSMLKQQSQTLNSIPTSPCEDDFLLGEHPIQEIKIQKSLERPPIKQHQSFSRLKSYRPQKQTDSSFFISPEVKVKKKGIKVPQKYEAVLDDIRMGRCELVDLTNAELGEKVVLAICELIKHSPKVKTVKLIRNKLADDVMLPLIQMLQCTGISSLNLGQNQLTERALDCLIEYGGGLQGKVITLSQNKINQRNARPKFERLKKAGLIVTL